MLPAGFEPAIPTSERPQALALDRSATEIGVRTYALQKYTMWQNTGFLMSKQTVRVHKSTVGFKLLLHAENNRTTPRCYMALSYGL